MRAIKVIDLKRLKEILLSLNKIEDLKKQFQLCLDGFIQEFEIMKICSINNNNSVKCYEYFNNKDKFVIIMELCDENLLNMLYKRLKDAKRGFNTEEIYETKLINNYKI